MSKDHDDEYVAFVSHSQRELRRTAYLICGDWHRAEDATQDALIRLYRRWSRVERRSGLLPYARRTLVRTLIDQTRRPWRREVSVEVTPDVASPATVSAIDDRVLLVQALAHVPPRRRACLVLRYYDELSVRETAHALGCSEGTVKSQTARGLEDLRRVLDVGDMPVRSSHDEGWAS